MSSASKLPLSLSRRSESASPSVGALATQPSFSSVIRDVHEDLFPPSPSSWGASPQLSATSSCDSVTNPDHPNPLAPDAWPAVDAWHRPAQSLSSIPALHAPRDPFARKSSTYLPDADADATLDADGADGLSLAAAEHATRHRAHSHPLSRLAGALHAHRSTPSLLVHARAQAAAKPPLVVRTSAPARRSFSDVEALSSSSESDSDADARVGNARRVDEKPRVLHALHLPRLRSGRSRPASPSGSAPGSPTPPHPSTAPARRGLVAHFTHARHASASSLSSVGSARSGGSGAPPAKSRLSAEAVPTLKLPVSASTHQDGVDAEDEHVRAANALRPGRDEPSARPGQGVAAEERRTLSARMSQLFVKASPRRTASYDARPSFLRM
jgi:hypothetical protein